jgi:hypothetical protein
VCAVNGKSEFVENGKVVRVETMKEGAIDRHD